VSYIWKVTGHFGHKTLRHQDTLVHFGSRQSAPVSRHFDTKNVVRDTSTRVPLTRKSRDTLTQEGHDNSDRDIVPPVIRLKLRHQFCGAEVYSLVAEVSGSRMKPGYTSWRPIRIWLRASRCVYTAERLTVCQMWWTFRHCKAFCFFFLIDTQP